MAAEAFTDKDSKNPWSSSSEKEDNTSSNGSSNASSANDGSSDHIDPDNFLKSWLKHRHNDTSNIDDSATISNDSNLEDKLSDDISDNLREKFIMKR